MVRFRNTKGETAELRDGYPFVEVCDADGRIAVLIYEDDRGAMKVVSQESKESEKYKKLFHAHNLEFCPVLHIKS